MMGLQFQQLDFISEMPDLGSVRFSWIYDAPVSVYKYVYMHFTGMSRVSCMRISDDADIDTFNNASNNNNRNNNY